MTHLHHRHIQILSARIFRKLPENRGGWVESVFKRAVNIRLADGTPISLLSPEQPIHPWAVRLSAGCGLPDCCPGERCQAFGYGLQIDGQSILCFEQTVVWDSRPSWPYQSPAGEKVWKELATVRDFLAEHPPEADLAGRKVSTRFAEVIAELSSTPLQPENISQAVINLCGLGTGLTPEGDDLLAGLLCGLYYGGLWREGGRLFSLVKDCLVPHYHRLTSPAGADMLTYALEGEGPKPLVDAIWALGGRGDLKKAIKSTLAIGSSSGTALLTGAVFGIALCIPIKEGFDEGFFGSAEEHVL